MVLPGETQKQYLDDEINIRFPPQGGPQGTLGNFIFLCVFDDF